MRSESQTIKADKENVAASLKLRQPLRTTQKESVFFWSVMHLSLKFDALLLPVTHQKQSTKLLQAWRRREPWGAERLLVSLINHTDKARRHNPGQFQSEGL